MLAPTTNTSNVTNVTAAPNVTNTSATAPQTTSAPEEPPLGSLSNITTTYLTLTMLLPISRAEFNEARQEQYRGAIARAAGLPLRFIEIFSLDPIETRRRLLATSLLVGTRVNIPEDILASTVAARLTERAINAQLPLDLQGTLVQVAALPPCGFPNHICSPRDPLPEFLPAPTQLPAGVSELAPRREEEGEDMGPCICDLTSQLCDANCNCDEDCSDDEKERFTADYGVALKQEGFDQDIGECVSKDEFLRINAPILRQDSPVCVLVNNNPSLGDFFTPPGASVTDDEVRLEFTEHGVGPWMPYSPPVQPDEPAYEVGMRIPTAIASTELGSTDTNCDAENCVPGVYGPLGYLSLPFAGPNGRCVPGNFVRFWEGTEEAAPCVEGGPVSQACTANSGLSVTQHAGNLLLAIRPTQLEQIPEWASQSKWLDVQVQVWVREASQTASNATLFRAQGLPVPAFDPTSSRCANVLTDLHLAIVRDGTGAISAATAVATLEHVAAELEGEVEVRQSFSASFLDADTASRIQPGLLAPLERSGRPGYVSGKGVVAGYANSSLPDGSTLSESIERLVNGLRLPRMSRPDGLCT